VLTRTSPDLVRAERAIRWNPFTDARVLRVLSVAVVLLVWQLVGTRVSFAISYPSAIFWSAVHTTIPDVLPAFGATMEAFWLGLGISIVVGVPIGLLMGRSRLAELFLAPYVTVMNSTPFVAFFPLFILIFGLGFELRLSVVVVTSLWAVIINTYLGVHEVPSSLLDVGRAFAARRPLVLRTIVVPATMRYIFAGIRVAFGHALIGIVVIEIEASLVGVGYLLSQDATALRIDSYFVPIAYLGFFSILCTFLFNRANRWVTMPWTRPGLMRSPGDRPGRPGLTLGAGSGGLPGPLRSVVSKLQGLLQVPGHFDVGAAVKRRRVRMRDGHLGRSPASRVSRWRAWLVSSWPGKWIVRVIGLAIVLLIWQAYAAGQSTAVVPEPVAVAKALVNEFFVSRSVYGPLASSCEVLLLAFAVSLVIGIPVGIMMGRSRTFERIVDPYIAWLYGLPHVAFIPLMVVWIGFGFELRFAYAVFSSIFIVIINTVAGVKSVDPELLACARSFCATERQVVRTVVLPGASPFIVAGAKLGFSASWIGVIVAEIIATQDGLGGLITTYSNNFQLPQMAVPIIVIMLISVAIFGLTNWVQPRLTPWARISAVR
jgi:ABC-type nitrate/sulfonate/bicarbonate transport system permease component